MSEPIVTINGTPLTAAQAMTLRVAVADYYVGMAVAGACGEDVQSEAIRKAYHERCQEIIDLMIGGIPPAQKAEGPALQDEGKGEVVKLTNAILIATQAHHGQADKVGEPYILHPLRVMLSMATEDERIVAVLHDVVEDTSVTLDELYWQHGFKHEIVLAIAALTRQENESYQDFIARCSKNKLSRAVKIADIKDNLRPGAEHLRPRYESALAALQDEGKP